MGGGAEELADVCKPAPDLAWGQGASGWRPGFPWAAQVCGMRAGQEQLGLGSHDQADPPVGLSGGADSGGGQAQGALGELKGVFLMRKSALGTQCSPVDNAAWRTNALAVVVTGLGLSA